MMVSASSLSESSVSFFFFDDLDLGALERGLGEGEGDGRGPFLEAGVAVGEKRGIARGVNVRGCEVTLPGSRDVVGVKSTSFAGSRMTDMEDLLLAIIMSFTKQVSQMPSDW